MINPYDYAFPTDEDPIQGGLTKREYFAAMAMQGLLSGIDQDYEPGETVNQAIELSDTLIEALNKPVTP
ncbi:hypothetical protein M0R72_18120 [Candidatus Pacearchaeota archaeon]|jgi:hypothetical protein|nr:hypothetical protein [Candidatus Pacearchaeota archaeon]